MKINYMSDLHLDIASMADIYNEEAADILVVAGDLAEHPSGLDWLKRQATRYEHVLYVLGNHEFYGNEFEFVAPDVREKLINTNITLLDNNVFTYKDVVFIGSVFWTNFNKADPLAMWHCSRGLSDYTQIKHKGKSITPEFILEQHYTATAFVMNEVDKYTNSDKKMVVITHHAPSQMAYEGSIYKGDILNTGFASEYFDFVFESKIHSWIYGHLHDAHSYTIGDTNLHINARGYFGHEHVPGFSVNKCIEV